MKSLVFLLLVVSYGLAQTQTQTPKELPQPPTEKTEPTVTQLNVSPNSQIKKQGTVALPKPTNSMSPQELLQLRRQKLKAIGFQSRVPKSKQFQLKSQIDLSNNKKQSPPLPKNQSETKKVQNSTPNIPIYCGAGLRKSSQTPAAEPGLDPRLLLTSTLYGFSMYVDSKDGSVSYYIRTQGTWEPQYINLIGNIVKEGDNVMNLGSQSGLEALVMGKIIGPTGRMFIFEPYSFSNLMVNSNVRLNGMQGYTTVYKTGASDEKSTAVIQVDYSNTGGSEITPASLAVQTGRVSESETVQIDKVDSVLPAGVSLNFALIDVEKMEIKALRGMREVIARSPKLLIMTEWQYANNPRRNQAETRELLNYLKELGYGFYWYSGGNYLNCQMGYFLEFKQVDDLINQPQLYIDVFFIPKDHPLRPK